jgi:hypothetical protein
LSRPAAAQVSMLLSASFSLHLMTQSYYQAILIIIQLQACSNLNAI